MPSDGIGNKIRRLWRPRSPSGNDPEVEATRPCPHCKQPVSRGATVCLHCERDIVPMMSYAEFAQRFGSPHAGGPPHFTLTERPSEQKPEE